MTMRSFASLCGLASFLAAGAAPAWSDGLTVVVDRNFPPFVEMADGEIRGLGIDALDGAADRAGVKITYLAVPLADMEAAVAAGEADAIFPLAINPERLERYDFSEPLLSTGGALFVAAPAPAPRTLQELNGKTVATPEAGPLANFIRNNAPEVTVVTTKDYDETLQMVIAGKADAGALNRQVGSAFVEKSYPGQITLPDAYFWELPLALAIAKGDAENLPAVEQLNEGIRAAQ